MSPTPPTGTALTLSGGGFRATLFHLGALIRLNELGILRVTDCIVGVSGGSIVAGFLGIKWKALAFDESGAAENFKPVIVEPILSLCSKEIDVPISVKNGIAMLIGRATDALENAFRSHIFGASTLDEWPADGEGPRILVSASNLQTGRPVYISRSELKDERLGILPNPGIPVAKAVAASSCFPPFLSPVVIRTEPESWEKLPGADLYDEPGLRARMVLTDGGIHDPLGVEPIWREYETLLISDSSTVRSVWRKPSAFWFRQLNRSVLLQTDSNSAARRDALIEAMFSAKDGPMKRTGVYWCNASSIESFALPDAMTLDSPTTRNLGDLRTRLNRFTKHEQGRLLNWGYAVCDAAMRSRVMPDAPPPSGWPVPEFAL